MTKVVTLILDYPDDVPLDPILEQTILFMCSLGIIKVEIGPLEIPPEGSDSAYN